MLVRSIIIDDFLEFPEVLRSYAIQQTYEGITSPTDGVLYPDVSIDIPEMFKNDIYLRLARIFGLQIVPKTTFMRLSTEGVHVPHQAHTDATMGRYTLLLYLNTDEQAQGGTELVRHKETGMWVNPEGEEQVKIWERDTNIPEAWEVIGNCPMAFNRGFIIDSNLFHRAQPVGGFGKNPTDGRLVLICFFDVA